MYFIRHLTFWSAKTTVEKNPDGPWLSSESLHEKHQQMFNPFLFGSLAESASSDDSEDEGFETRKEKKKKSRSEGERAVLRVCPYIQLFLHLTNFKLINKFRKTY